MSQRNDDTWVWVIIENPEKNENIVGQQDEKSGISFIPTFNSKEEGQQCMNLLARLPGSIYEPQAMLFGDLAAYAKTNNFLIFFLDGFGKVLEKIDV